MFIALAGAAAAAATLESLGSFGGFGASGGQLEIPRGVALDVSGGAAHGDVYVAEQRNRRVERFGPTGRFVEAFGREVNATKVAEAQAGGPVSRGEEDVCTAASGDACQAGREGADGGAMTTPMGIAVDPSSGTVYVEDFSNQRIEEYTPGGQFVLTFGGQVNAAKVAEAQAGKPVSTAEEDVCAAGEACKRGVSATPGQPGEGTFHSWAIGPLLAVSANDTVYVGDEGEVQEFDASGTYRGRVPLTGAGKLSALAVDAAGDLYLKAQAMSGVGKYDATGSLLERFDEGSASVAGVALGPGGEVYVLDGRSVLRYDASGTLLASSQAAPIEESTGIAVSGSSTVYVSDFGAEAARVLLFGSPPTEGLPPPAIDAEYAARVHAADATLGALLDPEFLPTAYYVQYGLDASYALGSVPVPPGAQLGFADLRDHPVSVALAGLAPGTAYHYRFVAISSAGTEYGPDRSFRTSPAGQPSLPDGRAYELVSPISTEDAEVAVPGAAGGVADNPIPLQASPDGEAISYASFTAFGAALSAPGASQYLSRRGLEGWSTQDISPPDEEALLEDPLRGFSEDLSHAAIVQSEPLLAPDAVSGVQNLYARDDLDGGLTALTTAAPQLAAGQSYCVAYAGASRDFGHVAFSATGALVAPAPVAPGNSLYEWVEGQLRLVSVLEGGAPAQPNVANGFGAGGSGCHTGFSILAHAISSDGSRVFWTYHPPTGASQLIVREDGARTVQLDRPQGGSGVGGDGVYWGASADGSTALFTDDHSLTPDAPASGEQSLYRYDLNSEALTDLTPVPEGQIARVLGVAGASEDAGYVYFVAEGSLAPGAAAFHPNLYVRHAGVTQLIATLAPADAPDWSGQPLRQTARVTPDGLHLAFASSASLTGYDNVDQLTGQPDSEVYEYDFHGGSLACVSCNPSGARPIGPATLPAWHTAYEQPRYVSDDGSRVFFDSFDALAPRDSNGAQDVYEWERAGVGSCGAGASGGAGGQGVASGGAGGQGVASGGCLYELSGGTSGDGSFFLDASNDGSSAFISTRQPLVSEDEDERFDVYDVRVGGGFPPRTSSPVACVAEACRPPAPVASLLQAPASATFFGPGNRHPRRHLAHRRPHKPKCSKRARRRHRRCARVLAHKASTEGSAGIASFGLALSGPGGEAVTQAGAHPDRMAVSFALNTVVGAEGQPVPAGGDVKDIHVSLPAGLIGDPLAVARCSAQQFDPQPGTAQAPPNACPDGSAVGLIEAKVEGSEFTEPIYDLVPPAGMPAQLGFQILGAPFYIDTRVRNGGDYGIDADMRDVSEAHRIVAAKITLWGVPADPRHDAQRGACLTGGGPLTGCPAGAAPAPFLTLPVSCGTALAGRMAFDSWSQPGAWHEAQAELPSVTGCSALDFNPSVSVQPDTRATDAPSGLAVKLTLPQNEEPNGLAEAEPRDAVVALPAGLAVDPAVAGGLAACSEQQIGFQGADPGSGAPRFGEGPAQCPAASQIGAVKIATPLLPAPLTGAVYVAQQGDAGAAHGQNPFGSLLALYLVAEGSGVRVKLAGEVAADPHTGQLTVSFKGAPQLPFGELQLELFGGARGPLLTPSACGVYASAVSLAPWSAGEAGLAPLPAGVAGLRRSDSFALDSGCSPGFAPRFAAGTSSNQAGAFSPFEFALARTDGEQALGSIGAKLPPGVEAVLAGVMRCAAAAASAGECSASSLIGHVTVQAGAAGAPVQLEGSVFLTGPYAGAPFGLAIVVPAVAGPFDLGRVVVRARVQVDPHTAQITVASDPLPRLLDGVPLALVALRVQIDRRRFVFVPTNCNPLAVRGLAVSVGGAVAKPSSRFQAAGCAGLAFHPGASAVASAARSRRLGASLRVTLRSGLGQSNIRSVRALLPPSFAVRLSTLRQACPAASFAADPAGCPRGAVVGMARVRTPLLSAPLVGPAYVVSHAGARFPALVLVLQGEGVRIDLVGATALGRRGTAAGAVFGRLPDVPFSRFDLVLPRGPHSLLALRSPGVRLLGERLPGARGRTCRGAAVPRMGLAIAAQDGAVVHQEILLKGGATQGGSIC